MSRPVDVRARTRRALHLVEGALVATLLAGTVAFLTTIATAVASAVLSAGLAVLAGGSWPDPVPDRLRRAALATAVQTTLLVAAVPAGLALDPESLVARGLSTTAGLALLVAIHLVADGFVRAFPADAAPDPGAPDRGAAAQVAFHWRKVWRSLRLLDAFLLAGAVLAVIALATSSYRTADGEPPLNVSVSFAPAAIVGIGLLYRLGRADRALRRWLDAAG